MRQLRPTAVPALACALALVTSGCQQADQELPFDLDGGLSASIGPSGGLVSVPPGFSMEFPEGSLAGPTQVIAASRFMPFPSDAGAVIPGSSYDVDPAGVQLLVPARVQIAVPSALLGSGDDLRLAVGLLTAGGNIVTGVTSYDIANGILTADVAEVGPVAAVISLDAIPVGDLVDIPVLGGGSIAPPSPAPLAVGPALAPGDPMFVAECSGDARNCFTSGIVQIWVDDVVRERLGDDMVLVSTEVSGSLEFLAFDLSGRPTSIFGVIEIEGDLRARLNRVVANRNVGDELVIHTGPVGLPTAPTDVTFSGNVMTLAQTSEGADEMILYGVSGIGTGEQITLQLDGEIEFTNQSPQPPSIGQIVAHVRLRR